MADIDVKSNLGAFAKYGKLASGDELVALDKVGAFLGTLGDIGGAIALIAGLLDLLGVLTSDNNDAVASLGLELKAVDNELRALVGDEHADHLLNRLRSLDDIASPAETAFERIKAFLPPNPPPSGDTIEKLTEDCVGALLILVKEEHWRANVFETPYYDDGGAWAGQIIPDESGGIAFSTKYILPTFLRTLGYFIAFGRIFDPHFKDNNDDLLRQCLDRLQSSHSTAVDGIVMLPRPTDAEVLQRVAGGDQSIDVSVWSRGRLALSSAVAPDPVFYRMYGAVSRFGEYFEVGNFPPVGGGLAANLPQEPDADEDLPPDYFLRFHATYDLKQLAARKTAYRELGLGATRSSIRSLQMILGDVPIDRLDRDMWWGLREISDLTAPAFDDPSNPFPPLARVVVGETISRLNALSGTPQSSLRTALNAVVLPIELVPVPAPDDGNN